jgi:3-dehydroquinate synthase
MTLATDGIERLNVDLEHRSYDIHVGEGVIAQAGAILAPLLRAPRTVIVTDELVAPHWLKPLEDSLTAAKIAHRSITLPPGEQTKSMTDLGKLLDNLLAAGIDRKTTLIALGGGVIGDLTGFAAAVALRGIDFVQVPTTLLAQVDSSVGGKTGIDTAYGKNLIGAFHQPRAVLADTATLDTLPKRELLCGYAEVVKYGVINDRDFFDWLSKHGQALLDGDSARRREAVMRSCANKAQVVAADEREAGLRALLNLGHTFGHALEAEIGFNDKLKHGEAVAIGIMMALDLSVRLALCPEGDRDMVCDHFAAVGLPTTIAGLTGDNWTAEKLLEHMGRDKKTEGGKLTFILARGIGRSFVAKDVDPAAVAAVLTDYIEDARGS